MQFIVITGIPLPSDPDQGNMATALGQIFYQNGEPVGIESLSLRLQVFETGEIIVANDDGREIGGKGRKPSKWFVDAEYFDTVEEAIARSNQVTNEGE